MKQQDATDADLAKMAATRSDRLLAARLKLLYRGTPAVWTNAAIACVVAWMLWPKFPHVLLLAWLAATAGICAVRTALHHHYRHATDPCQSCWALRFTLGALAAGLMWGVIFLGLQWWGGRYEHILLIVVATGMAGGALATIAAYLPAYFAYTGALFIPLATVSLTNSDDFSVGIGAMMVVYCVSVFFSAKRANAFIKRTITLKVDNEILQESLTRTRVERDKARTDKWSTLAQLSHELRTPLNAILGFSEAMNGEIFGGLGHPRYKEYAEHILTSGRDLLTLAEELLVLSQGEAGTLTLKEDSGDVGELIRFLIDLRAAAAGQRGIELQAYIASDLPMLKADFAKLRLMLLNLIDNGIKFTPGGGEVTVTARLEKGGIVLRVRDTGIGMGDDEIAVALEPFGRASGPLTDTTEGAGLGLPICSRLADLHGATLDIVSCPGDGTTCTIAFPPDRTLAASAAA